MGKSPVIYTRISRGTGIAGCFAGEHLSRAPPGSPGEGGGGGGKRLPRAPPHRSPPEPPSERASPHHHLARALAEAGERHKSEVVLRN